MIRVLDRVIHVTARERNVHYSFVESANSACGGSATSHLSKGKRFHTTRAIIYFRGSVRKLRDASASSARVSHVASTKRVARN
jgi:hypothetical protein